MSEPATLEVLIRTRLLSGRTTLQGLCSNGEATALQTIRTHPKHTAADLAKAKKQFEAACGKMKADPDNYAFDDLKKAVIEVTENRRGHPHIIESRWTCTTEKDGMPPLLSEIDTAPSLPTLPDHKRRAKEMGDLCGFRIREATAR